MNEVPSPLPPGPSAPPVRQLLRYTHSPLSFLEASAHNHGTPFTIRLAGYGPLVMFTEAEAIKDIFRGDPKSLHSGEGNEFLSVTVGKSSVLVLDEERHARQRRAQLPPLKGERMRSFFAAMRSATLDVTDAWPVGQTLDMVEPMQRLTLQVMVQVVLGLTAPAAIADVARKIRRVLAFGRSRYTLIFVKVLPLHLLEKMKWLPFYRQMRDLDEALFALIRERRQLLPSERGENVLADLLAATHEDGQPLSNTEIRDAIVTLLIAGHDTTAAGLSWALEQIVPRAEVMTRVTEELRQVTGGGPPRADQLDRLEYLDAVIRESMRMRTIVPFVVRLTKVPFTAGGREYPPGVLLCPCSHLVHRRPDLYSEPEQFRPERFLERKFAGHEWFPFGGGNRACLGMAFALHEMKVVLATLLARVELSRPPKSRSTPIRRGIILVPDDGARMTIQRKL